VGFVESASLGDHAAQRFLMMQGGERGGRDGRDGVASLFGAVSSEVGRVLGRKQTRPVGDFQPPKTKQK
jgi:hypothetical protein